MTENRYVISDQDNHPGSGWSHFFIEDRKEVERDTRFVYDMDERTLVSADVKRGNKWHAMSRDEKEDLTDSLENANWKALEEPDGYGLVNSDDLPEWSEKPSPEPGM